MIVCGTTNIDRCYNKGAIKVTVDYAGGIVGIAKKTTSVNTILNSYNTGTISGGIPGGLIGCIEEAKVTIDFCYNIGILPDSGMRGGIVGKLTNSGTVQNNNINATFYLNKQTTNAIGNPSGSSSFTARAVDIFNNIIYSNSINSNYFKNVYPGWDIEKSSSIHSQNPTVWEIKETSLVDINGVIKRPLLYGIGDTDANR